MGAPVRFKQDDVKRAFAGAKAAGFSRVRVGIDVLGNIVVEASNDPEPEAGRANPLDRLLGAK